MDNTICAIATSVGVGAISIIKISGSEAIKVTDSIFSGNLIDCPTNTIKYGFIVDDNIKIDEVLISVMRSPKTYTTEDVVEINCHGGVVVTNRILEILLNKGCSLAEPGEFTKRAYLNGRIDLVEAEAVSDIINAATESASKLAINQIQGKISKKINNIRKKLLEILANIEVNIDYPEYEDIEVMNDKLIKPKLLTIQKEISKIINESNNAKIIKNGIDVAIIGKPNVGKSSILNFLLDEAKAIVTDVAGTTRDIVEGKILLNGILINLFDTAGIRSTNNPIEKMGVDKSLEVLKSSDLIIFVLNNSDILSVDDLEILEIIKSKNHIIFINKSDLQQKISTDLLTKYDYVLGNTINDDGLDKLKTKIVEMFNLSMVTAKDPNYLSNVRQISLIKQADLALKELLDNIENLAIDLIAIDVKRIWDLLGEILGESYNEELLDELFSNFCLGK